MTLKFTNFKWVLKNHAKSKVFQNHSRPVANLSKILIFSEISFKGISFVKLTPPPLFEHNFEIFTNFVFKGFLLNFCERSVDQAGTISLRGPKKIYRRARSASLRMGWDGMDGWDGISKVSFNFLYTLWVYRLSIYLLIHEIKIVTKILWVSKFDSSWQWGSKI